MYQRDDIGLVATIQLINLDSNLDSKNSTINDLH